MHVKYINSYDEIDDILNEYYTEDYDEEYVFCENDTALFGVSSIKA